MTRLFGGGGGSLNPMVTQDDLIVGGSGGAPSRLVKGADGQVLTVDPVTHHLAWSTIASDAAWTNVTYESSWVDFGAPYLGVGFRKDGFGLVHLRGLAKNGSSLTANIFTLPVGYRPAGTVVFVCLSNGAPVGVQITAAGGVAVGFAAIGSPSTAFVALDGVTFWT